MLLPSRLTCPLVPVLSTEKLQWPTWSTSAPFRARHMPVSGQLCEAAAEGGSPGAPVSCGLSACRHSLLDHPFPPHRSWASLTVGLPGRTRTPTGPSRSARPEIRPARVPLNPEATVFSRPTLHLRPP